MLIDSADPTSFHLIASDGTYAADKEHVYWFGVVIPQADPETFRILSAPYAVDNTRAFAGIVPFEVQALEQFEVIRVGGFNLPVVNRSKGMVVKDPKEAYVSGWCRDGTAYYWGWSELEDADYESFQILNALHGKDSKSVYFRGRPIQGADAKSFNVVGPGDIRGQDKNFEYRLGVRIVPEE